MSKRSILPEHGEHTFVNPFQVDDLLIFDHANLCRLLAANQLTPEHLAWSLHKAPSVLSRSLLSCLPADQQAVFCRELVRSLSEEDIRVSQHLLLDTLFWELTYWKTPELYKELVEGEALHPGIFQQLEPWLRDKIVLDAGAGCGRATRAILERGAALVHAVEPSPGLRRLFEEELAATVGKQRVVLHDGDFAHLPLPDQSVDATLACSAFTAAPGEGGEAGLAEFRRVTRAGGAIVLIWPRPQDRVWLAERGFRYVAFPQDEEMGLTFASWTSAWRCVHRFYAGNRRVLDYLRHANRPRLPFSVLGVNAPCDYCFSVSSDR